MRAEVTNFCQVLEGSKKRKETWKESCCNLLPATSALIGTMVPEIDFAVSPAAQYSKIPTLLMTAYDFQINHVKVANGGGGRL
jgi:hypothetical protein